jgi:hypothetical protein
MPRYHRCYGGTILTVISVLDIPATNGPLQRVCSGVVPARQAAPDVHQASRCPGALVERIVTASPGPMPRRRPRTGTAVRQFQAPGFQVLWNRSLAGEMTGHCPGQRLIAVQDLAADEVTATVPLIVALPRTVSPS